jgi:hypothetical protein
MISMILGSFHDLPCPFKLLFSSLLLPTFFYLPVTLLYFNAFHFLPLSFHARYFHVLPLSVHILSLSLHVMSKILTDRIFGMPGRGHHGGHTLYV